MKVVEIGVLPEESTPTLLSGDQSLDDSPECHDDDDRGDNQYLFDQRGCAPCLLEASIVLCKRGPETVHST
jgi:hypothetical protein